MITETRPFKVNLTDQIEVCQHDWPIEGSKCPVCFDAEVRVELEVLAEEMDKNYGHLIGESNGEEKSYGGPRGIVRDNRS